MRWQFTIIDFTVNPFGDTTVLDEEPLGWKEAKIKIQRGFNQGGDNMHGIFFNFIAGGLEFVNIGYDILDAAYQLKGVDASVKLIIKYACSDTDSFTQLYLGSFDFKTLEYLKKDYCSINIQIDRESCFVTFQNRYDQKVDLESLTSFDGESLTPYTGLGRIMFLDGKSVELKNDVSSPVQISKNYTSIVGQQTRFFNFIGFEITNSAEAPEIIGIEDELFGTSIDTSDFVPSGIAPLFEAKRFADITCKQVEYNIEIYLQGNYSEFSNDGNRIINAWSIGLIRVKKNGQVFGDILQTLSTGSYSSGVTVSGTININFTDTVIVDEGDVFYLYAFHQKTFTTGPGGGFSSFDLDYDFSAGYFNMTGISECEPTESKVFQINEVFSRISESITNDCLRVFSNYFGRLDSQPYVIVADRDGCGSNAIITNGLFIRDARRTDGSENKIFVSFKEIFEGINAIHNIGLGIEPDPNRTGYELIRIEPVNYWYEDTLILTCENVKEITIGVDQKMIYSQIEIGYSKWESESTNGLDEFLTKRIYRTFLKSVTNTLSKVSNLIASGYSIEFTRRQKRGDTQDWKYDNDNFIVCTQSTLQAEISFLNPNTIVVTGFLIYLEVGQTITISGSASNDGAYTVATVSDYIYPTTIIAVPSTIFTVVETVINESSVICNIGNILKVEHGVSSGNNIIQPSTIYNARISPVRNLMRWFRTVATSWSKEFNTVVKELIFNSSDGNYIAEMQLNNTSCTPEGTNTISESQNIDINDFDNAADGTPLLEPETIEFTYPLSRDDFDTIIANPKGYIKATQGSKEYDGYIDELEYDPNAGLAQFKLIKKFNNA